VLAEHAAGQGIAFMSTAFSPADFAAVDPHVQAHKIASYEVSHPRLIELAARSGKPTLMSTGAATPDDIAWAVDLYAACGGRDLCLLQCTAKYPAPPEALNLRAIRWLRRRFRVVTGLSDHSREPLTAPTLAVGFGARAIEKHFTIDNRLPGPDHAFAVTPEELARMVAAVRTAEAALGPGVKTIHDAEAELASFAQRALQAIAPIRAGDALSEGANIGILRPGKQTKGLHPRHLGEIEGKRAARALKVGEGLRPGDWID
jgi:sialic acid synthase SpsE